MNFTDWKARLEAEASKFDDPEAASRAALEEGAANYEEFMGIIHGFLCDIRDDGNLSEEEKAEIAVGFLRSIVDSMTRTCTLFARKHPDEAEAIIDWHQNHIEFFKGLIAELEEAR
jgi:hypothetical protein